MTKFKFKIEKISNLEKAKTIILDGILIDGTILTNSSALLDNDETKSVILIKGVVLGESKLKESNCLSVTIDASKNKTTLNLMKEGDFLVGI